MEVSFMYMLMGYAMCYLNPLYFFILLFEVLGLKFYVVFPDRDNYARYERVIGQLAVLKSTAVKNYNGREFLSGVYVGRFLAVIDARTQDHMVYLFATPAIYAAVTKEDEHTFDPPPVTQVAEVAQCISVYRRRGCYKSFYYIKSRLDLRDIQPIGDQPMVLDSILQQYADRGRATVVIHGAPCTGKSTVGYLVAKQLRGHYCHTFNPNDPGDSIHELMHSCEADSLNPLIVVLEEIDGILQRLDDPVAKQNPDIPTEVHSKATWTAFLDDMIFLKHVILILTSNKPKTEIDAADPALLRQGRIHASYSMSTEICAT